MRSVLTVTPFAEALRLRVISLAVCSRGPFSTIDSDIRRIANLALFLSYKAFYSLCNQGSLIEFVTCLTRLAQIQKPLCCS